MLRSLAIKRVAIIAALICALGGAGSMIQSGTVSIASCMAARFLRGTESTLTREAKDEEHARSQLRSRGEKPGCMV